jgi:hypothetical protein
LNHFRGDRDSIAGTPPNGTNPGGNFMSAFRRGVAAAVFLAVCSTASLANAGSLTPASQLPLDWSYINYLISAIGNALSTAARK